MALQKQNKWSPWILNGIPPRVCSWECVRPLSFHHRWNLLGLFCHHASYPSKAICDGVKHPGLTLRWLGAVITANLTRHMFSTWTATCHRGDLFHSNQSGAAEKLGFVIITLTPGVYSSGETSDTQHITDALSEVSSGDSRQGIEQCTLYQYGHILRQTLLEIITAQKYFASLRSI